MIARTCCQLVIFYAVAILPVVSQAASFQLTGNDATGALNLVGFDNEINEPSATPPSSQTTGSSHGFPYFQYVFHPDNPDSFNDYEGLWSIIVSSHTVIDAAYYESVLVKAGMSPDILGDISLTVNTTVAHPNPANFNLGTLGFDESLLTGSGLEILAPHQFTLGLTRDDYSFNVLNEDTTPGSWVGFPYYYWGVDDYSFAISSMSGTGLTFQDGDLSSMDFVVDLEIISPSLPTPWEGTLTFTGNAWEFDVNDINTSLLGDIQILMDRSGTLDLSAIPEPSTGLLAFLASALFALRRRARGRLAGDTPHQSAYS